MVEERPLSASVRDARAGIELDELAKIIKAEKMKEECVRRNRFTQAVLREHERTSRSASASSARAKAEMKRADSAKLDAEEVLAAAKDAEEHFAGRMKEVIQDENERMEEEAKLEAEIKANHGKVPGYFKQVPSFMRDKNAALNQSERARSPRSRMLLAQRSAEMGNRIGSSSPR